MALSEAQRRAIAAYLADWWAQRPRQGDVTTKEIGLETISTAFRLCAYNCITNAMIGDAPLVVRRAYERMKNPSVGDWVIEASTIHEFRHLNGADLNGIGVLEEIAWEKVDFEDPAFVWDEEAEGAPHPTERVYYIRTMDGRRFRWTNATIVAVQSELVGMFDTASRAALEGQE